MARLLLAVCGRSTIVIDNVIGSQPASQPASQGGLVAIMKNNDSKAEMAWTPLHCAAQAGHQTIVSLLFARGADP